MKEKKKFIFPENISDSGYNVLLGLSLKELLIYVAPATIVALIILFLPPYSFYAILFKLFLGLIFLTVLVAVLTSKPVKNRNNIRLIPHLKMQRKYKSRQKLYFIGKKKQQ